MFQSLRPNNQIYILRKDKPSLEIGSVVSVSMPTPKYQMQPTFGQPQEMVVDIVAKVNNQDVTYMCKADYLGSSISDDQHLVLFIKDYVDDKDGYSELPFTRFYADCVGTGTPIDWEDMI